MKQQTISHHRIKTFCGALVSHPHTVVFKSHFEKKKYFFHSGVNLVQKVIKKWKMETTDTFSVLI